MVFENKQGKARRSNAIEGCVKFPLHLKSTAEGGMFVKLWVFEKEQGPSYGVCSGTHIYEVLQESLRGSDLLPFPNFEDFQQEDGFLDSEKYNKAKNEFYLKFQCEILDSLKCSTGLLADVLLGSTGWSGDFICTYEDLTDEGKKIYDSVKALYPQAEFHLVTFVDT